MIEISEHAVDQINFMLSENDTPDLFLRVGVEDGGCSGLSYNIKFDDTRSNEDLVLDQYGFKVVIDSSSEEYLAGIKIDYKQQGMTGGFTIDNPNAKTSCGCGASFRTATYKGKSQKC